MTSLTHNIAPSLSTASFPRQPPLDCRVGSLSPVAVLARVFKLTTNTSMSEADLINVGEPLLREMLAMSANMQRPTSSNQTPTTSSVLLGGIAGYSMNDAIDSAMVAADSKLLRLATEVQTLIRGANGVKMTALGEAQLKTLKAHFEQA